MADPRAGCATRSAAWRGKGHAARASIPHVAVGAHQRGAASGTLFPPVYRPRRLRTDRALAFPAPVRQHQHPDCPACPGPSHVTGSVFVPGRWSRTTATGGWYSHRGGIGSTACYRGARRDASSGALSNIMVRGRAAALLQTGPREAAAKTESPAHSHSLPPPARRAAMVSRRLPRLL